MEKRIYMRKISTKSTLDWVMGRIKKAHKGYYDKYLEEDKKTIARQMAVYGWYTVEPKKKKNLDDLNPHIAVGVKQDMPKSSKATLICMGHYFNLYEYDVTECVGDGRTEVPTMWVVPK